MRLFVAVTPPADVLADLAALPRREAPGVRWTTEDQWHVTLRFLGEVGDPAVVVDALGGVEAAVATALLGPSTGLLNPRIVAVPVEGLDAVAAAVIAATRRIGRPPERRPFRGHLTLARLKGVPARVARPLVGSPVAATWAVDHVDVMRSHLSPKGARYEVVAAVPLQARPGRPTS